MRKPFALGWLVIVMNESIGPLEDAVLSKLIRDSFKAEPRPGAVLADGLEPPEDYSDALALKGRSIESLEANFWINHPEALHGLNTDAFRYYLPSLLLAGIEDGLTQSYAIDRLIDDLDRSDAPGVWDAPFVRKWAGLNVAQLNAVMSWIIWLGARDGDSYGDAISRACRVLASLKRCRGS